MFVLCFEYLHRLYNTSLIIKLVSRKYYENGFYSPYNGYKMFVPTRRGSAKNNVTFFFSHVPLSRKELVVLHLYVSRIWSCQSCSSMSLRKYE